VGIGRTIHATCKIVRDDLGNAPDGERDPIHVCMTADNNFIFFGPREKSRGRCGFGAMGGYVVEAIPIQD